MKLLLAGLGLIAGGSLLLAEGRSPIFFSLGEDKFASTDLSRWLHYEAGRIRVAPDLAVEFVGSAALPRGYESSDATFSAFLGSDPKAWQSGKRTFKSIIYRDLYAGVDLICRQMPAGGAKTDIRSAVKSDFVLHPGADVSRIRIRYAGADSVRVLPVGEGEQNNGHEVRNSLEIKTRSGTYREHIPEVFQEQQDGSRLRIAGHYLIFPDQSVGFELPGRDPALKTVIDPQLIISAYWAGNRTDGITAVAFAADNSLLIAGWTESTNLPSVNPVQYRFGGATEGFVARLSSNGQQIIWATVLGGMGQDRINGIAFDNLGAVIVAGQTGSSDFPARFGMQDTLRGSQDGFVAKIDYAGTTLRWATFFGGNGIDTINAVASGPNEKIYLAGQTTSTDLPTKNPIRSALTGASDGFAARMNQDGRSLDYGTYWGGSGNDAATGIAMRNQETYITGWTDSTDFPVAGAFQATNRGGTDAFVSKLNFVGTSVVYSSYLGGYNGFPGLPEMANGIAVNGAGEAVVVGVTASPNFWLISPARDWYARGGADGFVTKVAANGASLAYSTYLGGTGFDIVNAVSIRPATGQALVVGMTSSADFHPRFVLQGFAGFWDAFVTQFSNSGQIEFSSVLGGSGSEAALAVAVHPSSTHVLIGGTTQSLNFPITFGTPGTADTHGFFSVVNLDGTGGPPPPAISVSTATPVVRVTQGSSASPATVTVSAQGGYTGTVTLAATNLPSGVTASFVPPTISNGAGTSAMTLSATPIATTGTITNAKVQASGAGVATATSADFSVEVAAPSASPEVGIGLVNTGTYVSGGRDLGFTLRTGNATLPAFVTTHRPSSWIGGAGAAWIAPAPNQTSGSAPGNYNYDISFDLAGTVASTAVIEGVWSAEDTIRIRFNSQLIYTYSASGLPTNDAMGVLHAFRIDSGFVAGANVLTFEVINNQTPNVPFTPTGLRVEFTKATVRSTSAAAIPVYGTGVQSYGSSATLYSVGSSDPRWVLAISQDPSYPGGTAPKIAQATIPPWVSEAAPPGSPNYAARWIAPRTDVVNGNTPSSEYYIYYQVVDLTGIDKNTAQIKGRWASDNESEIRIRRRSNGSVPEWPSAIPQPKITNPSGQPNFSFDHYTDFTIPTSQLVDGEDNLIEVAVKNNPLSPGNPARTPTGVILGFDGHPFGRKMADFRVQPNGIFFLTPQGSQTPVTIPVNAANELGWTRPNAIIAQLLTPNPYGLTLTLTQLQINGTGQFQLLVTPIQGQPPGDYLVAITLYTSDTLRPLIHTRYVVLQVR